MHDKQFAERDAREAGVKLSNKEIPMRRGLAASLAVWAGGDAA